MSRTKLTLANFFYTTKGIRRGMSIQPFLGRVQQRGHDRQVAIPRPKPDVPPMRTSALRKRPFCRMFYLPRSATRV